jgi:hypothetical protein
MIANPTITTPVFATTPPRDTVQDPATIPSTCTANRPAPVVSLTVAIITESALIKLLLKVKEDIAPALIVALTVVISPAGWFNVTAVVILPDWVTAPLVKVTYLTQHVGFFNRFTTNFSKEAPGIAPAAILLLETVVTYVPIFKIISFAILFVFIRLKKGGVSVPPD